MVSISTQQIQDRLAASLSAIGTCWALPDRVAAPSVAKRLPGPSTPLSAAWLTREAAGRAVGYWLHAAYDDGLLELRDADAPVDLDDVAAGTTLLRRHVVALSGWVLAEEMIEDLAQHAGALIALTTQPTPGVLIGTCPLDGHDGYRCDGPLVATGLNAPITCPCCGRTGTVAHWAQVLTDRPMLMDRRELVDLLVWIGVRATPDSIRKRSSRGALPQPAAVGADGEALYSAVAVLAAYLAA